MVEGWVNWFRKDEDGSFLWPGFGENSRVLKWIVERVSGETDAVDTPIGRVPATGALDTVGLDIDHRTPRRLLAVNANAWRNEISIIEEHYRTIGDRLPGKLAEQLRTLDKRLAGRS